MYLADMIYELQHNSGHGREAFVSTSSSVSQYRSVA